MLQTGDKLGFAFKAPDKFGLAGKLRQNNFDGDFAPDGTLIGFVNRAKPPPRFFRADRTL